ncbi:hypothetical protein QX201_004662 [Fusarium graminearum]
MEGYDDVRCLPRIPKLFPTSDSQPELVLFSASSDTGSSTNSAPHALDTCNDSNKDGRREEDQEQTESLPSNAPHSTLITFGDEKAMF